MVDNYQSRVLPTRYLCDPKFVYVSAAKTDIAKTFKRIRLQLALTTLQKVMK